MEDTLRIELAGYLGFILDPLDSENNVALIERLVDFFKPKPGSQTPGILPKDFIYNLFCISYKYHKTLPNVVRVNRHHFRINNDASCGDLTIVGDLHGQCGDFAQIFQNPKLGGYPSETNRFIFNGDMVDRGPMELEIILYPQSVHILRGNHETRSTTAKYGFKKEVVNKYNRMMYKLFMILFDTLPVAAIVDNVVFVTHGGIGPAVANLTIEELDKENRIGEVASNTVIGDLLWADPIETALSTSYRPRPAFTQKQTEKFLTRNNPSLLVRSHEHKTEGFDQCHNNRCWTVFSAPNYCGTTMNKAAVLKFNPIGDLFNAAYVVQFNGNTNTNPGVCRSFCIKLPVSSVPVKPENMNPLPEQPAPVYSEGASSIPDQHVPVYKVPVSSEQDTSVTDVLMDIEDCEDGIDFDDQSPDEEATEYFDDVQLDLP